jgi:hypothetical protein
MTTDISDSRDQGGVRGSSAGGQLAGQELAESVGPVNIVVPTVPGARKVCR